jgi:hypothetical protein
MSIKSNNNLKFTYLLGAGASVGTIPVVKRFGDGLTEFIEFLREAQSQKTNSSQIIGNLIIDAIKLSEELNSYASFDTFAKKLYLLGKVNELTVYKRVISTYILYCNLFKPRDTRYDLFFASILDKGKNEILIPDNVNLITWNYDRLADISLQSILSCDSFQLNSHVNLFNNYDLEVEKKSIENTLNIVKLNGAEGAFIDNEINMRDLFITP